MEKGNAYKKKCPISYRYLFFDFVKLTAIPGLLWFRIKKIYENDAAKKRIKGGALLISNHSTFYDPVILMISIWYRRHHFICTKDFFEGKVRLLFKGFHCIPINKQSFGMDSFRVIVEHLQAGELVSMFPEGRVNVEGEKDPYKSGMVMMSAMSGKPIIPVYMERREHWYHTTRVVIGEPVDIRGMYGGKMPPLKKIDEIAALLQEKEDELKGLLPARGRARS
ncbi:MAG: 1-acyl-sn-glycerol-3-phosphate acyltransferase [Lachnospiraceae bacterium]|nr:1-acyl-sn-glycerol-3-phosphate acyltransferase [Candidatus Merdinaster equi]